MRFLGLFSAFLASLTFIRMRISWGVPVFFLWIYKAVASALSPVLALMGFLITLIAFFKRDRVSLVSGIFTTAVSMRHIEKVTRSQDDRFTQVFGANWWLKLPPAMKDHMLPARWSLKLPAPAAGIRFQQHISYGKWPETGEDLYCDLWRPPEDKEPSGLAIIYLHGSAWHYLGKDFQTRPMFRHLASQGHVVMDVAYTLAPKADLFGMVGDVKRAIAWFKSQCPDFGVNPDRIVLVGASAGGHLALLSAYTPNDPAFQPEDLKADTSVHGVVSYYGFADLLDFYQYFSQIDAAHDEAVDRLMVNLDTSARKLGIIPDDGDWVSISRWIPNLFGGTPEEVPEAYRLGSPIHYVCAECPPTMLIQGAHDVGGMVAQNRNLHQALRAAGAQSIYLELPDTEHAFDIILPQISPSAQTSLYYLERFLALLT